MSIQTATRRKRRIASDEAHSWARNLRLGNPYARMVLTSLTLYVNGDGVCYVAIGDGSESGIAYDTELSPDTVRKRLAWLEQVGAIVRFAQWIDAAGRRNGEGKGKRTSDEIRLMIDADQDEIEARARGENIDASEPECNDVSPRPQQGPISEVNIISPLVAPGQPSDSGEGLTSEPEPEILSQSPFRNPGGEDSIPTKEEPDKVFEEAFQRFDRHYPIPIDDVLTVRRLLSALDEVDREEAIIGALGYRYFVKDEKRKPWNATKFLRQHRWPGYVQLGRTKLPKARPPRYFLLKDSPEYQGLLVGYAINGLAPPRLVKSTEFEAEGVFVDMPPNAALASLALFVDWSADVAVVENTKRWHAWRERLSECGLNVPLSRKLRSIGAEERDKDGRVTKVPRIFRGARFPACWPPRKPQATSPPLMSQVNRELAHAS